MRSRARSSSRRRKPISMPSGPPRSLVTATRRSRSRGHGEARRHDHASVGHRLSARRSCRAPGQVCRLPEVPAHAGGAGRDRERLRGGQRFRSRRARSRRSDRAGAGVGRGALRARQALAARRTTWSRPASRSSAPPTCCPGFGPAWANLGGTLGELDRPQEALAAFERALALDPASPQALNNVGVVRRELGRLSESEAAFRQVIQLTPGMAFGHYNLGHTLFLQGRFQAALSAYAEGQARDPEKNPVQASRLALCKVATGDAAGALRELQRATAGLPREYRQQLLGDTSAILWALVTQHPELHGMADGARMVDEGTQRIRRHERTRPSPFVQFITIAASASRRASPWSSPSRWRCCSTSSSSR